MRDWISRNRHVIGTWATIIQTGIAVLMALTLIQNHLILRTTERQLKASIDPVLTAILSGPTIHIVNDGIVDVVHLRSTAAISVYFNLSTLSLSSPERISRGVVPVSDRMRPGDVVEIHPFEHLWGLGLHPTEGTLHLYAIVLSYRRAVDMKPFELFLPFTHMKDTETQSIDVFMPLFPSPGASEMSPVEWPVTEVARSKLIEIYRSKLKPIETD